VKLGFPHENDEAVVSTDYNCRPTPDTLAVAWMESPGRDRCRVNLYRFPPRAASPTHKTNRAILSQEPIEIECDPLTVQLTINYLVQLYQATLPAEVTT
jgi:hypothetical protein